MSTEANKALVCRFVEAFNAGDLDELLSLQGTGGPMTAFGVEHFVDLIERKRRLKEQVDAIAGTEYLEVLEKMVALMYEKIQPYRERGQNPPVD